MPGTEVWTMMRGPRSSELCVRTTVELSRDWRGLHCGLQEDGREWMASLRAALIVIGLVSALTMRSLIASSW